MTGNRLSQPLNFVATLGFDVFVVDCSCDLDDTLAVEGDTFEVDGDTFEVGSNTFAVVGDRFEGGGDAFGTLPVMVLDGLV